MSMEPYDNRLTDFTVITEWRADRAGDPSDLLQGEHRPPGIRPLRQLSTSHRPTLPPRPTWTIPPVTCTTPHLERSKPAATLAIGAATP